MRRWVADPVELVCVAYGCLSTIFRHFIQNGLYFVHKHARAYGLFMFALHSLSFNSIITNMNIWIFVPCFEQSIKQLISMNYCDFWIESTDLSISLLLNSELEMTDKLRNPNEMARYASFSWISSHGRRKHQCETKIIDSSSYLFFFRLFACFVGFHFFFLPLFR